MMLKCIDLRLNGKYNNHVITNDDMVVINNVYYRFLIKKTSDNKVYELNVLWKIGVVGKWFFKGKYDEMLKIHDEIELCSNKKQVELFINNLYYHKS